MPDNSAAWAVAGNATSDLANTLAIDASNRQSRRFSREMYDRQRADSLQFWNDQNAYNSPAAQMARFKAAGLNPNLIYGRSGDNSAGNIDVPGVTPAKFEAPHVNFGSNILAAALAHADLRIKGAQANNLNEQTEVIRQDGILRALQAQKEGVDIERAGFDLGFARRTADSQADFLAEGVRQRRVGTDLAINRDVREAAMNVASVSELAQRVKNMIEQNRNFQIQDDHTRADTLRIYENIRQMQKDGRIKDFELKLNRDNFTKSDPYWLRTILNFLEGKKSDTGPVPFKKYEDFPLTPKRD